jgi:uncharacterized protein (TIGR03000 family)
VPDPNVSYESETSASSGTRLSYASASAYNYSVGRVVPEAIGYNEIHLIVNLPEEAKMFVNGNATSSTGKSRHFVSRDLQPGQSYRFDLKMVVEQDGETVERHKTVVLESGRGEEVTFDSVSVAESTEPVETVLRLNVPEGAVVFLGNNETKTQGSSRIYRTRQLRDGEAWDDYEIKVTFDGVTKNQTIRLIGGDDLELSFDFSGAGTNDLLASK